MIWTHETLVTLFSCIKRKFGVYAEWEFRGSPGRGRDVEYLEFCSKFADIIGAGSYNAVGYKTVQAVLPKLMGGSPERQRRVARIVAAALEAGFIRYSENGMDKPASPYHTNFDLMEEIVLHTTPAGNQLVLHNRPIGDVLSDRGD